MIRKGNPSKRTQSRRKATTWLAVGVATCLALAACSSSGSHSGAASGSAKAGQASGGGSAEVAAARALIAKIEVEPTTLGRTDKVGAPIPKGKRIAFVSCGNPSCNQEGVVIKQATDLLAWSLTVLNTDGTPTSEKAAFDQVVRQKFDAVLFTAINATTYASEAAALKANGTYVSVCCVTDPVGAASGIDYSIDTVAQTPAKGEAMAAWVSADSGGKADAVYVTVPTIPILGVLYQGVQSGFTKYCPDCSVSELDLPITSLGKDATTTIVSYLRAHPKVKYVIAAFDDINIGLTAALKAAGLNDVRLGGQGPTATNIQYIRSGQQSFTMAFPYYEDLFSMVDAVARHEAGVQVSPSLTPPLWIITKSNAPVPGDEPFFPIVTSVQSEFKSLWGLTQ